MRSLPAMFCYYGAKWRAAPHYPTPRHDIVIEPFAGAAGFSLLHHRRQVRLYDLNPRVIGVWQYLIGAAQSEILALPDVTDSIPKDLDPRARDLIGFWLNKGCERPRVTPSSWMRSGVRPGSFWGAAVRRRIAGSLPFIRHWTADVASFEDLPNIESTWFIDPPYQGPAGRHYVHNDIDYARLSEWCRSRRGFSIVCESAGANWLPFDSVASFKGLRGRTAEVAWTSPTHGAEVR